MNHGRSVVIYMRVSTVYQIYRMSLQTQESLCRTFAESYGYTVKEVIADEGISGKDKNREGLNKALNMLNQDTYLLVYSLSRLTRSIEDSVDISRFIDSKRSRILSFSENFTGIGDEDKFAKWLYFLLSEQERKATSLRVSHVMQHRKEKLGHGSNQINYGWKLDSTKLDENGKLIPLRVRSEQAVIAKIMEMRQRPPQLQPNGSLKSLSYKAIADYLNKEGIPTRLASRNGVPCKWRAETIGSIIHFQEQNYGQPILTAPFADDDDVSFEQLIYILKTPTGVYKIGGVETIDKLLELTKGSKLYISFCLRFEKILMEIKMWIKANGYLSLDEGEDIDVNDIEYFPSSKDIQPLLNRLEGYTGSKVVETSIKELPSLIESRKDNIM